MAASKKLTFCLATFLAIAFVEMTSEVEKIGQKITFTQKLMTNHNFQTASLFFSSTVTEWKAKDCGISKASKERWRYLRTHVVKLTSDSALMLFSWENDFFFLRMSWYKFTIWSEFWDIVAILGNKISLFSTGLHYSQLRVYISQFCEKKKEKIARKKDRTSNCKEKVNYLLHFSFSGRNKHNTKLGIYYLFIWQIYCIVRQYFEQHFQFQFIYKAHLITATGQPKCCTH